jgi:hypothetical protein
LDCGGTLRAVEVELGYPILPETAMKSRLTPLVAALLLAGAAPHAYSQAASPAPADVAAPTSYADSPVASVSKSDDLANAIAQALVADGSLKDSKITVQPEENGAILLTGVTPTNAQRQKALEIATSHAGAGKVSNALTSAELVITPPVPPTVAETATEDTVAVASDFVAAPEPAAAAQPAPASDAAAAMAPAPVTQVSPPSPAPAPTPSK